jgi:FAD:protein FMN transferase
VTTLRRARLLLGTLVEVTADAAPAAIEAAFAAVDEVQRALSRFDPGSEVARFNTAPQGERIGVGVHARAVLQAAAELARDSGGRFDIALGSGRWALRGSRLVKIDAATRIDLGGIGKGYAVDRAVEALRTAGARAGCVNAGGDLRCFGATGIEIELRDEVHGGVRRFGRLHDGAFATSRSTPFGAGTPRHVSVLAPTCLLADALTKLAALGIELPPRCGARAWVHA